uniref:Uncharacterized protein n=1 Tax=Alexandrium monilatum TaxID=311494 RepID=A0A7S4W5P0_9DINO|mmetsp:Transcript_44476/g.139434  ORF Transcript_44476/g.139434 Transcript_44476/m.139434 type:complete len:267 (+) Transcript_44476:42-842(+)
MGACNASTDPVACSMAGVSELGDCRGTCADEAMIVSLACSRDDTMDVEVANGGLVFTLNPLASLSIGGGGMTQSGKVMASCKLLHAAAEGNLEGIREALAQGAELEIRTSHHIVFPIKSIEDMDQQAWQRPHDDFGTTQGLGPLQLAAKEGWPEAVRLLLSCRASPHAHDEDGLTALHFAALSGCRESCRALLEAGARPRDEDDGGRDAFACVPPDCLASRRERLAWQALLRPSAAQPARLGSRGRAAEATAVNDDVEGVKGAEGL